MESLIPNLLIMQYLCRPNTAPQNLISRLSSYFPLSGNILENLYPHSSNHDTSRSCKAIAGKPRGLCITQPRPPSRHRRLSNRLPIHLSSSPTRLQSAEHGSAAAQQSIDHPRSRPSRLCNSTLRRSLQLGRRIGKTERPSPAAKLPLGTPATLYDISFPVQHHSEQQSIPPEPYLLITPQTPILQPSPPSPKTPQLTPTPHRHNRLPLPHPPNNIPPLPPYPRRPLPRRSHPKRRPAEILVRHPRRQRKESSHM